MSSTRPSDVRRWLDEAGVVPSRRLGQNFLIDGNIARIVAEMAGLTPDSAVLEIGPGCGALTEELLRRAGRVVAIEKDERLHGLLARRFAGHPSLELVRGDALEEDMLRWFPDGPDFVVANLPYSVGTRILVRLCELPRCPRAIVVTLQREVVQRIVTPPGGRDYGLISVAAQRLYRVECLRVVPPSCFFPAPEVDSAVIRMTAHPVPVGVPVDTLAFHALLKWVFAARRKQLWRGLRGTGVLPAALAAAGPSWLECLGIEPSARPETLDVAAWTRLCAAIGVARSARGARASARQGEGGASCG